MLNKIKIATASVKCEWNGKIALFNKKLWDKTATCEENLLENPVDAMPSKLFVNGADTGVELSLVPPEISGVYDQTGSETYSATTGEMLTIKGTFFGVTPPAVWMEYPVYQDDGTTVKEIKCLRLKCYKVLKYKNSKNVLGKSCMDIETGLSEITVSVPKFPANWDHSEYHNIVIDNKVCRATIKFQTEK